MDQRTDTRVTEAERLVDRHRRMLSKLQITFRAFGIDRDDRLELSRQILMRDNIASFNDLSDLELMRMLDAMEGAALVAALKLRAPTKPLPRTLEAIEAVRASGIRDVRAHGRDRVSFAADDAFRIAGAWRAT